jgi:hypothetical protein
MRLSGTSILALGIAMTLASGCNDPTSAAAPTLPTPAAPDTAFPALTHPGTIYVEAGAIYEFFYNAAGPVVTRYVLYDDGTFDLQFAGAKDARKFSGSYTSSDSLVQFAFTDRDSVGPWEAIGHLEGSNLSVTYNDAMMLADFIDGTYRKSTAP